jgi:A/G-specific adenine glycosylase
MVKNRPYPEALLSLAAWFERQKRVLPWRETPTLYRVWISEIMLQQTQVVTVVPYFERFIASFPDVETLARASEEKVMLNWAGLGYYSRARNLHKAAQEIVTRGDFPRDREGWLEVPGVGGYTAGAILSIALNQPEAILDGNVERVLARVRCISRARGDALYKARLWRLSGDWVTRAHALGIDPRVTNQALMELGAMICTPKKPKCLLCPIQGVCRADQTGRQEEFPPRKKSKQWISVQENAVCLIDSRGRVLLRKRAAGEWRAGLWDLPEQLNVSGAEIGEVENRLVVTNHKITRRTRVLIAPVKWTAAEAQEGFRWIDPDAAEVPMGSGLKKTLQRIREKFPEALRRS